MVSLAPIFILLHKEDTQRRTESHLHSKGYSYDQRELLFCVLGRSSLLGYLKLYF